MPGSSWEALLSSLYDVGRDGGEFVPGVCVREWVELLRHDYDAVDMMYLDSDTLGGD